MYSLTISLKVMTVGIIGLGLIGGSFAKAYKSAGHTVLISDVDEEIRNLALLSGAADSVLDFSESEQTPDVILIAVYPNAAIEFLEKSAGLINPKTTVIDCCGTKKKSLFGWVHAG
jgi:prephenate dehydrogenase